MFAFETTCTRLALSPATSSITPRACRLFKGFLSVCHICVPANRSGESSCADPERASQYSDGCLDDPDLQLECGEWGHQRGLLPCGCDQQCNAAD